MAVDTAQKRFSAMNTFSPWRGTAVVPSGTISGAVRQAIAFLYSGILAQAGVAIAYVQDLNTRLRVYLLAYYGLTGSKDLTTLADRYMDAMTTGDRTQRFRRLMQDATDAMP